MVLRTLSLIGYAVMVAAVVVLFLIHALVSPSPLVIGVQVAGAALMVWARVVFRQRSFHARADPTEGGLVTTGPYRWIRHPIYTGVCLFVVAGISVHLSLASVALGLMLFGGALTRMLCEERLVTKRYPEYAEYARTTKRMIPHLF